MGLIDIKNEFIKNIKEGNYYDSSSVIYARKINVFYEYLEKRCGVKDENYKEVLVALGKEKILDSIEFYISENNIKFRITVENYLTVIKAFFDYISREYNLKNKSFDSLERYSSIRDAVNKKMIEMDLKGKKDKAPISENICKDLIKCCDENINNFNIDSMDINKMKKENSKTKAFNYFVSGIITKIVILTGIKNNVINVIKIDDYDSTLNTLIINGFKIHLPDNLGNQMKKYISVRKKILSNGKETNTLFINKRGEEIGIDYGFAFSILKEIMDSNSAESVAKYTIIQFIKKGININLAQQLTGFGDDTFLQCQEIVNEEKNGENDIAKIRYIDSKIRSLPIYDCL